MSPRTLTVAAWNLGDAAGEELTDAWRILRKINPDVLLLSARRLFSDGQVTDEVKLEGVVCDGSAQAGEVPDESAQGVFVRTQTFSMIDSWTRSRTWWLHPAHLVVRFADCPTSLNLVSFYMCRADSVRRQTEARALTELAHPGMFTLAGGPTFSYPHRREPLIDLPVWTAQDDPAHRAQRTRLDGQGAVIDTLPDAILTGGDPAPFHDLARYTADRRGLPNALLPTTADDGLIPDGGQRTYRIYGTRGMTEALHYVKHYPQTETRHVTPHSLVIARFHRSQLARLLCETD